MKRLAAVLFFFFSIILCGAQNKMAQVVLKNKTVITGVLKELNPTSHIIISVSGFDSRIEMSDIESIKSDDNTSPDGQAVSYHDKAYNLPEELVQMEQKDYPSTFNLNCDGEDIEMVLIRGGVFSMGYDGRGSVKMSSEPVHNVFVSSFYISKECLTNAIVKKLQGKEKSGRNQKKYVTTVWKNANEIASLVAEKSSLPIRLPSEAEWEYAVSNRSYQSLLVFENGERDFCLDCFASYTNVEDLLINPIETKGKDHVIRVYGTDPSIYCNRIREVSYSRTEPGSASCIRIVIPAADVK